MSRRKEGSWMVGKESSVVVVWCALLPAAETTDCQLVAEPRYLLKSSGKI